MIDIKKDIELYYKMIGEQIDFSAHTEAKLKLRPILTTIGKVATAVCPNPNITLTLPNKITVGCR